MENLDWGNVIAVATTFVLSFVLPYVIKAKKLLKEGADVFIAIDTALEDNKVTAEEITKIKKESREVWNAIEAFKAK